MEEKPKPQLVTCQYCQTEAPPEAVHCPNCGQPMPRYLLKSGEEVCDDYQVVRLIGYGGMGEVYLAQHHLTGQQVAIKVLALHLAEEVDLRIRFLDEARILARLDHPNIVMLHNFKQERDRMHILMQYVDGTSLDRIVEAEGALDSERAALLFAPLCDALAHAHENAIIHRDLKPSNILVDRSGKGRLTDFGIAKLTEGGANLTRTGTRVGTSWFMSPEQGMNKPADARSDIYSLGVTLYNCLSGRLPFSGDSEYEVIKGHVELPPPPIFHGDDPLDRDVERVVMQALAKNPEERFQSGSAMRDALLEALTMYGDSVDVRATPNGAGVFAIQKGTGVPSGSDQAQLPGIALSASKVGRRVDTMIDPVYDVEESAIERPPTPPLGSISRVQAAEVPPVVGVEAEPHPPSAMDPARSQADADPVDPVRLQTPPGRPPAPGMSDAVAGVLLDEGEPSGGSSRDTAELVALRVTGPPRRSEQTVAEPSPPPAGSSEVELSEEPSEADSTSSKDSSTE